jgi:hypothetical protein
MLVGCVHSQLKPKHVMSKVFMSSVVNPDQDSDPHGSRTFCRIRIRDSRFRFWFQIQLIVQKVDGEIPGNHQMI